MNNTFIYFNVLKLSLPKVAIAIILLAIPLFALYNYNFTQFPKELSIQFASLGFMGFLIYMLGLSRYTSIGLVRFSMDKIEFKNKRQIEATVFSLDEIQFLKVRVNGTFKNELSWPIISMNESNKAISKLYIRTTKEEIKIRIKAKHMNFKANGIIVHQTIFK